MNIHLIDDESSFLAPHDPSIHPDNWPVFELNDVYVIDPNDTAQPLTSLLNASSGYPLTVVGKLAPVPKEHSRKVRRRNGPKSPAIKVEAVRIFSYGAWEDGSIGLWAGGKAGWFYISPAPAYQSIYDEMTEAVRLFYFIADSYATPRTSGKGKNASTLPDYTSEEVFSKYASEEMGGKAKPADGAKKVYQHRYFLLSSMISGKEGIAWGRNPVYAHLRGKFPEDWDLAKRRLAAKSASVPRQNSQQRVRQASIDSESTSSSLKRKRGRPHRIQPADTISTGSSSVSSPPPTKPATAPVLSRVDSQASLPSTRTSDRLRRTSLQDSHPTTPEVRETPLDKDDDDDSSSMPAPRAGKSGLRLKPLKSMKGPIKTRKADEEEDEEAEAELPPTAANRKRKLYNLASAAGDDDEDISIPTSLSAESDQADQQAQASGDDVTAGAELPERLKHAPDPVQEDTWVCALAGCTHKVYGASRPESQKLIRQHYALHACDDDERVQMVKNLAHPSLPVGHLIERVKMQAKVDGFPGSRVAGTRFPEVVKQKY